ncbi:MAG: 3-methyl-2-oxobutanoate hydroxymethyltransferase [Candidatus Nitrosocaldaceae archaeon]|nr:MAG: 3-methyl-2-oxobutanoate hydroxymethyltransferase [Candidatus Nitrosocaldaceae archaeon]
MKVTVDYIKSLKNKRKISMLTAYDYTTSIILDNAGIDILLVGDSAGMVMLGYDNTIPVSMEEMLLFCKAVSKGRKRAMVVADMPFMSYHIDDKSALENAFKFIKYANVDAVKMEGGKEMSRRIKVLVEAGIPVMAHIGLKPQTATLWHGYKVHGLTRESALELLDDAKALEEAGAFSIVLEQVTFEVAKSITERLKIPTIGIGSGNACDGQVLVIHDMLGLYEKLKPRFVKRYAELGKSIDKAVREYIEDINSSNFPSEEHTFYMDEEEYQKFKEIIDG